MNSKQEGIVSLLISRSMGGPFLFFPEEYLRGDASREPADMVWASNGCVILFAMTSGGGSREKMLRHNLRQLRGTLKAWRRRICTLRGKSSIQSFDIKYGDFTHVVLVSVVDGSDTGASYHPNVIQELASVGIHITACATIPQVVLEFFAEKGEHRDLLQYLRSLKSEPRWLSEQAALDRIQDQHYSALLGSTLMFNLPGHNSDSVLQSMGEGLVVMRQQRASAEIFNDLQWVELFELMTLIRKSQQDIDAVPLGERGPKSFTFVKQFPPYHFVIGVHRITDMEAVDVMDDVARELSKHVLGGRMPVMIHVVLFNGTYNYVVAVEPVPEGAPQSRIVRSF